MGLSGSGGVGRRPVETKPKTAKIELDFGFERGYRDGMSYSYLETETEEEIKHGDDDSQEVTYQEMLVKAGVIEYGDTVLGQEELAAKKAISQARMVPLICSCGSMKCYAIRFYGLPKPVFHEHIEPLPMFTRDPVAARMKADGYGN
jgi:hypothetical protein